eukprot:6814567-Ditylum_brightwellii.AAC.1
MKAAFGILSETTGHGYERIQKRLELVTDVKFPSKYILDKEWPPIERMIITPLKSPNDGSAGFGNNVTNCTTEGETDNLILSCGKIGSDWKFDKNIALMVASQKKEGEDMMGAKLQGGC